MAESGYNAGFIVIKRLSFIMLNQVIEFITHHWIMVSLWLIAGSLLFASISKQGSPSISAQQLITLFNKDHALIIDIRTKAEFNKGHITDALNIPLEQLNKSLHELEKSKNNPIIVVCNAGIQASGASNILKKEGFERVFKLQGGMQSWLADHLPVVQN